MKSINIFLKRKIIIPLTTLVLALPATAQELVHPGGMQTQAALTLVRDRVAEGVEPWRSAWEELEQTDAMKDYIPDPRNNIAEAQQSNYQRDGHAAYVLAVKWAVSGDIEYAETARRIVDAWVDISRTFDDFSTRPLRNGIASIQMANAAEILATAFDGSAGWPQENVEKAKNWFRTYIDPTITTGPRRSSNFGTSALAGSIAIAIFLDDREKFNDAVFAYQFGFQNTFDGCAHVTDYIWHPSGQSSESGRDQIHTEGGIGHLVETALMARNQGVDLVSFADYRLVAGMEYTAAYNLGNEVVFRRPLTDECGIYPESHNNAISPEGRFEFAPVWEMAERLFSDFDVPHPFTTEVVNSEGFTYYPDRTAGGSYRPESTNSDNPGMGTLLYSAPGTFNPLQPEPTVNFISMRKANSTSFAVDGQTGAENGQNVQLVTYDPNDEDQHWEEISRGDDFYSYRKRGTDHCLDGDHGGENRQTIYIWSCSDNNQNQHWRKIVIGNNVRLEKRNASSFSIDGDNGGTNGQDIYMYQSRDNNLNQQWIFTNE